MSAYGGQRGPSGSGSAHMHAGAAAITSDYQRYKAFWFYKNVLGMAVYSVVSGIDYMGLILGIFYMVTGGLGVTAGTAAGGSRGLAIASLVMSILSILNSFALIIYAGIAVSVFAIVFVPALVGIVGTQLAFFILLFISSIVMCVFAVRAMSTSTYTTHAHVTQVTRVSGQPGMVYGGGPQFYPAGQPGQYAGQPYPVSQQGQYAAPYPPKV